MGSGPYISRPGDTHRPYSQDKKSPFDNGRFDTERPFSAREFDTERSFGTHAYIERPLSGLAGASSGGFLGDEPLEPFLSGRQVSSQRGSVSQRGGGGSAQVRFPLIPALLLLALLLSSLELSDTKVYEPQIRARLGIAAHFCEVVVSSPKTAQPQTPSGRTRGTFNT